MKECAKAFYANDSWLQSDNKHGLFVSEVERYFPPAPWAGVRPVGGTIITPNLMNMLTHIMVHLTDPTALLARNTDSIRALLALLAHIAVRGMRLRLSGGTTMAIRTERPRHHAATAKSKPKKLLLHRSAGRSACPLRT